MMRRMFDATAKSASENCCAAKEDGGQRVVVEPCDADVLGNAPAGIVETADQAHRCFVVTAEDRGDVIFGGDLDANGVCGTRIPGDVTDGRGVESRLREGVAPAGGAAILLSGRRHPHVMHCSVAESKQVAGECSGCV